MKNWDSKKCENESGNFPWFFFASEKENALTGHRYCEQ